MIEGNLTNNTKTRRKGSMLQDILSKIKYLLVLALLLMVPVQAMAGFNDFDLIDQTDQGADDLVYYWDTQGRDTFIQVTNTSGSFVSVHVQVFNATLGCDEVDFFVDLTPFDTNIYDIKDLPGSPDLSDSHGIVVISAFAGPEDVLIGMFRIIDGSGYEYRTNAASTEDFDAFSNFGNALHFNNVNGNNLSDVVGITFSRLNDGDVVAAPSIGTQFGLLGSFTNFIVDENEFPFSCSATIFACDNQSLNRGIDNSIPNSQGFNRICNTSILSTNDSGWLFMPFVFHLCTNPLTGGSVDGTCNFPTFFVGYLGLNNGDGTGSMDSWWQGS